MNPFSLYPGVALSLEEALNDPLSRLLVFFSYRLFLDAVILSFGAVLIWRVVHVYPAWNKACKGVHGRSWSQLLFAKKSSALGDAHPSTLAIALCFTFVTCLSSASHWVGEGIVVELAKWEAAKSWSLAWMLGYEAVIVLVYSLFPLLVINAALRDHTSSLGGALQNLLGHQAQASFACMEAQTLTQECLNPKPIQKKSWKVRRL